MKKIDIALLSETWLRNEGDEAYITSLTPNNYKLFSFPCVKQKTDQAEASL